MSLSAQPVSPKASTLPPIPSTDPFTASQWKTLLVIADTIIPAIKPQAVANAETELSTAENEYSIAIATLKSRSPDGDEALVASYLQESASSYPEFREALRRLFGLHMPSDAIKQLGFVLNMLE